MDMDVLREKVTAVLGPVRANLWLRTPHDYLGGQTPWEAGRTPAGLERLEAMVGALLDGAFL